MSTFKRHLPAATDIHSLHVAINRIWDAIESGSSSVQGQTAPRIAGTSVTFGPSSPIGPTVHNALSGLQGGETDNYWHLTNAEYTGNGTGVLLREYSPILLGIPTAPAPATDDNSLQIATTEWVRRQNYQPQPPNSISGEMTGFCDTENVSSSYDPITRTITLSGTVQAYYRGVLVPDLVPGWVSSAHANTNGTWFLYYDDTGFHWSNTAWTFDKLMIAYVNYGVSDKFAIRETHGLMPWLAHEEFHRTIGTYLESGGDMSGYVTASTTPADRRPAISPCSVHDEDLHTTISALVAGTYTQLYLTSTGTSTFTTGASEIVPVSGSHPYYNQFSTPNWVQTLMSNNSYMTVWLVAAPMASDTGSQAYRFFWAQGQTNGSLSSQQQLSFGSLNLGQISTLFTEFVPIGKVIILYQGGDWKIESVEKITGTRVSSILSPAGTFLSSVSVSAPLTGTGIPSDPIVAPVATNTTAGLVPVPSPAGGSSKYLREDMTWASPGGGPGVTETFGNATIDFGAYPGSAEASVAVTGQTGILSGSNVRVWVSKTTSADHTADDHCYLPELASFVAGDIIAGTGFTIHGRCILGGLQGKWTINWAWI